MFITLVYTNTKVNNSPQVCKRSVTIEPDHDTMQRPQHRDQACIQLRSIATHRGSIALPATSIHHHGRRGRGGAGAGSGGGRCGPISCSKTSGITRSHQRVDKIMEPVQQVVQYNSSSISSTVGSTKKQDKITTPTYRTVRCVP